MHSCHVGRAIFIDARCLGLSVCCRWIPDEHLSAFDFASAVGLTLPGQFRLCMNGGDPMPSNDDVRRFDHCASVVLWVGSLLVARAPVHVHLDDDDGGDDHQDPDVSDDDLSFGEDSSPHQADMATKNSVESANPSRSRSPRDSGRKQTRLENPRPANAVLLDRSRAVPTPCRAPRIVPKAAETSVVQDGSNQGDDNQASHELDFWFAG